MRSVHWSVCHNGDLRKHGLLLLVFSAQYSFVSCSLFPLFFLLSDIYALGRDASTRKAYWRHIHSTEVVESSRSPRWSVFVLRLWDCVENDLFRPLLLRVWDHSVYGAPALIGEVQTNVKEILARSAGASRFPIVHPTAAAATMRRAQQVAGSLSAPVSTALPELVHAGSLVFTYARVFSDIKCSQIERGEDGPPRDIVHLAAQTAN